MLSISEFLPFLSFLDAILIPFSVKGFLMLQGGYSLAVPWLSFSNISLKKLLISSVCYFSIVCIGVPINPPSKPSPLFLVKPPLKYANFPTPFFRQSPLYWFFVNPPKNQIFLLNPKNVKNFHPLPPSYLLKVTKFLVKISKFWILTTVYRLFLSLNISDFGLNFLCKNCNPPLSH